MHAQRYVSQPLRLVSLEETFILCVDVLNNRKKSVIQKHTLVSWYWPFKEKPWAKNSYYCRSLSLPDTPDPLQTFISSMLYTLSGLLSVNNYYFYSEAREIYKWTYSLVWSRAADLFLYYSDTGYNYRLGVYFTKGIHLLVTLLIFNTCQYIL